MLKKIKKIFYYLSVACLSLGGVFITACIDKPNEELPFVPENYDVVIESTLYSHIENCKDFIALCKNFEEFKQECLQNGYDFFDGNNQENNYYNTSVGQKIREYTDAYFEEKVFLVCAYYKDSWIGQYRIDEININAEKLTLYIKCPKNNSADQVVNNVFIIAGIGKSLVSSVTDVEYILR